MTSKVERLYISVCNLTLTTDSKTEITLYTHMNLAGSKEEALGKMVAAIAKEYPGWCMNRPAAFVVPEWMMQQSLDNLDSPEFLLRKRYAKALDELLKAHRALGLSPWGNLSDG